jgi:hypothetical protein
MLSELENILAVIDRLRRDIKTSDLQDSDVLYYDEQLGMLKDLVEKYSKDKSGPDYSNEAPNG